MLTVVLDASGWIWTIPLHNGSTSVGVACNQVVATQKKRKMGFPSSRDFYLDCLQGVPSVLKVLGDGELISDLKNASDWSYSAGSYASPHVRWLLIPVASSTFYSPLESTWPSPTVFPLQQQSVQPEEGTVMRQSLLNGTRKKSSKDTLAFCSWSLQSSSRSGRPTKLSLATSMRMDLTMPSLFSALVCPDIPCPSLKISNKPFTVIQGDSDCWKV